MTTPCSPSYAGYRFPVEVISCVGLAVRPLPAQPARQYEKQMKRFKSARQVRRFLSIHDPIANLFHVSRSRLSITHVRAAERTVRPRVDLR